MNKRYYIAMVLMVAMSCLLSPDAPGQTSRVLPVRLDTVRLNVCEGKNFLISVSIGDISLEDSLVGGRVIVAWDRANLDFEDLVILSSETLGNQFSESMVTKDSELGTMFIEMGNYDLRPVAGKGKPLFFLKGKVTAPDTVAGQNGWIQVLNMSFESATKFQPDLSGAGMVRVVRDTTAGFTGHLSATVSTFDTLRADTVSLVVQNLRNRRVSEVSFRLTADTRYYEFADTIETGLLAGTVNWDVKELTITPEAIEGRFVADSALKSDGGLIKIILRRTYDSAFTTDLVVDRFTVNRNSCLGKLAQQSGQISGLMIPKQDTSTSSVADDARRGRWESVRVIPEPMGDAIRIIAEDLEMVEVGIFDVQGNRVPLQSSELFGTSTRMVRFDIPLPGGTYFVALRDRNSIAYKQFTIIK